MKTCQNCGALIPAEAKFCPVCGAAQPQIAEPTDTGAQPPLPMETAVAGNATFAEQPEKQADDSQPPFSGQTEDTANLLEESQAADPKENLPAEGAQSEAFPATDQAPEADPVTAVKTPARPEDTPTEPDTKANPAARNDVIAVAGADAEADVAKAPVDDAIIQAAAAEHTQRMAGQQSFDSTTIGETEAAAADLPETAVSDQEEKTAPLSGVTEYLKSYCSYLRDHIKEPRLNQGAQRPGFAGIGLVIVILSNTLVLSGSTTAALQRVLEQLTLLLGLSFVYEGPGLMFFFEILLTLTTGLLLMLGAYYIVAARIYRRPLKFAAAVEEIMAPASLAVCTSLLSVLLAPVILRVPTVGLALVGLNLFLITTSFVGNLWHAPNLGGTSNRYYTTVLTMVVVLFLLILVGRIFAAGVLQELPIRQQLPGGLDDFFNQNEVPF